VNCTNQFDAASGFGGYRESGYGREGGKEGLYEYVKEARGAIGDGREASDEGPHAPRPTPRASLDRTHKLYIGGKQARPDSGYSLTIGGEEFARANRKDVRNAVEAARSAQLSWGAQSGHARAQILYYLAENLQEVWPEATPVLFEYAARADKLDGQVHNVPLRSVTYTLNEPVGVVAIVCPSEPDLALIELIAAAMAAGNAVVAVVSETDPRRAVELYRVIEASDVPPGVLNLLTGIQAEVEGTLAEHDGVDVVWHFGSDEGREKVERLSVGNLKQVWTGEYGQASPRTILRHATQVKNIWVPYGT
ncbi:MAG TPA: aldehyde dehydrogenase family protein, partial [Fimbriimonas sp.]